jgi:aminopeptidase-like protein
MSNEGKDRMVTNKIDYKKLFEDMKELKPKRLGVYLGEESEKFYVALSEDKVYELSALAYYVWLLCDGEHTVNDIANRMSNDVKLELSEIVEPLVMALNSLSEAGLVKLA